MSISPESQAILDEAQALRDAVPELLTDTSRERVEIAWIERRNYRIKIKQRDKDLARQIKDLQAERGVLEIADDYQDLDCRELERKKWQLINDERALANHSIE